MAPWTRDVKKAFRAVPPNSTDEAVYYGPYNLLLNTLFPPGSGFMVTPQFKQPPAGQATDFVTVYMVERDNHPVFFVEVKSLSNLVSLSKREEADLQMRQRFGDFRRNLVVPVLHGVSAFGPRLCFYRYDVSTNKVTPERIVNQTSYVLDTAPESRWDCGVLEAEGAARLKEVVDDVKNMCAQIPREEDEEEDEEEDDDPDEVAGR